MIKSGKEAALNLSNNAQKSLDLNLNNRIGLKFNEKNNLN